MDPISQTEKSTLRKIDVHVHIVGNGTSGSGCYLKSKPMLRFLESLMCKHIGLPADAMSRDDFDQLYVSNLVKLVQGSSLDAAVILAHDQVYGDTGVLLDKWSRFYVPNSYVLKLARKHPELLPSVSIHPGRVDAMEELERCLAGGAVQLKLLPNCHGVDCNLKKYQPFWERMAEAGLPLLAHTGGEHTLPQIARQWADPRTLLLPLECGVKVIAAHSATKSGFSDPEYVEVLAGMMKDHPRLYADNSAFNIPIRSRSYARVLREPFLDRILHGSDLPVLIYGHWAWMRGLIDWKTFRRCQHEPNVLERDYQIKKAIGFPDETFTRAGSVLRPIPRHA